MEDFYELGVTPHSDFFYFLIHTESERCSILMSYVLLDGKASISKLIAELWLHLYAAAEVRGTPLHAEKGHSCIHLPTT